MDDKITLFLDDGRELECEILTIFEADGQDYIALLPTGPEYEESGDVFLYRYSEDENHEPILDNITSDEEYEIVDEAFDEWLDANEYDEIVDEEELDFNN